MEFGKCGRCYRLWAHTTIHTTYYTERRGCFALCEPCWSWLNIERRIPYYVELIKTWDSHGWVSGGEAEAIIGAVRRGL